MPLAHTHAWRRLSRRSSAAHGSVLAGLPVGLGMLAVAGAVTLSFRGTVEDSSSADGETLWAPAPASLSSSASATTGLADHAGTVRYGRDIRRLLSDRCFQCHGPDAGKREADLRLDVRESATAERRDGKDAPPHAAIVAGDATSSTAWQRINSTDPNLVMPPPSANKRPLSVEEKGLIEQWINEGAIYEPHWSFVPPVKTTLPAVRDERWPKNELDRFVLANLEAKETAPSPEADKLTLARRVFFDLTGLPPTPEELAAFEEDTDAQAYEKLVDRLLTQEPYRSRVAERLTQPWLDAARYADTSGIHTDNGRQAWLWRDWVLAAFRDNMPYDQFITEQLAGDLIPSATIAQKIASGFNRNHVTTDEGGAIPEEYLVEYAVDRVSTTGAVFLGLTMGCVRCHDHKFDPISQEDFYSFYAFFNSVDEPGLYSQTADANRAYEPFLEAPTPEQRTRIDALEAAIAAMTKQMEAPWPGEAAKFEAFKATTIDRSQARWEVMKPLAALSTETTTKLRILEDASVQAEGGVPATESFVITGRTTRADAQALSLEILSPENANGKLGRSVNGNIVITGVTLETKPIGRGDDAWTMAPLRWAWADHTQDNGNFEAGNVLNADDREGWALDAHRKPGSRTLLIIADRAISALAGGQADTPGGKTPSSLDSELDVRVTVSSNSVYAEHTPARVRLSIGTLHERTFAALPIMLGRWHATGPFPADPGVAFETEFGPDQAVAIDPKAEFGAEKLKWQFDERYVDGKVVDLPAIGGAMYMARTIWSPTERTVDVLLGSDDGFKLWVNGELMASRKVDRSPALDQDRAELKLRPGANTVVFKIVNTGGPAAYAFRLAPLDQDPDDASSPWKLDSPLVGALLQASALGESSRAALAESWKRLAFPEYQRVERERRDARAVLAKVQEEMPRAMVMKELATPRETFILTRGQYDKPDKSKPVHRGVPKALGRMPEGATSDRLGLAGWIVAPENPLTSRVAVNRMWEMLLGSGLVRTSEDFGLQGEWPTHPELLDWLAVDFREHGWDVRRLLRQIVTSATYRQSSRVRTELAERDPENRWLSYYPRRRLGAEQVRDLALFASGLLSEKFGGPSVKTYHPDPVMWKEIALPASNTQNFVRDNGPALWRRSLYTYWKRASPPPSLSIFDAPTREACVIRRPSTNTPLQALALWNDTQMLEAARKLAQRTLQEPGDDAARLRLIGLRCAGREFDREDLKSLLGALESFRDRYRAAPKDAEALIGIGEFAVDGMIDPAELAAWTMIASAILNLHETITQD